MNSIRTTPATQNLISIREAVSAGTEAGGAVVGSAWTAVPHGRGGGFVGVSRYFRLGTEEDEAFKTL